MTPFQQLQQELKERKAAYRGSPQTAGGSVASSVARSRLRLGDMVEKFLEAVIRFFGIPKPKGCGCKRRKEMLNDLV